MHLLMKHQHCEFSYWTRENYFFIFDAGKSSESQHFFWLRQEDQKHSVVLLPAHAESPGPFHSSYGELLFFFKSHKTLQLEAPGFVFLTSHYEQTVL